MRTSRLSHSEGAHLAYHDVEREDSDKIGVAVHEKERAHLKRDTRARRTYTPMCAALPPSALVQTLVVKNRLQLYWCGVRYTRSSCAAHEVQSQLVGYRRSEQAPAHTPSKNIRVSISIAGRPTGSVSQIRSGYFSICSDTHWPDELIRKLQHVESCLIAHERAQASREAFRLAPLPGVQRASAQANAQFIKKQRVHRCCAFKVPTQPLSRALTYLSK